MSALWQITPPAWSAHGGLDVLEPACAYDAFVALVRGLLEIGYRPAAVGRLARRRWDSEDPLPIEVRRLLGRAADVERSARHAATLARIRAWRRSRSQGRPTGAPRQYDHDRMREMFAHGLSDRRIAGLLGCSPNTVRDVRTGRRRTR